MTIDNYIMEIKEFIEKFAGQFLDTELSVFTKDTVFHELDEYTSLIALMIISMRILLIT